MTGVEEIPRRGFAGKEQAIVDRARQQRPLMRLTRPGGGIGAVCLDTTPDDIVEWLRARSIEILPATFKETMALGCNVVTLGQDRVLSTLGARNLNAKMRAAGFTVYDPDMTMYTWAGGGVHCMCQPLRREAG